MLKQNEEILTGGADRIFTMAETAQRATIGKDKRRDIFRFSTLLATTFIISACLVIGLILVLKGKNIEGVGMFIAAIGSLVWAARGREPPKDNPKRKFQAEPSP